MPDAIVDSCLPPGVDRTVVTVGTFDGIHLGHQDLLARLVARARSLDRASVVVTFDPHPLEVVNPAKAPLLLTPGEEKLDAIVDYGVEYLVVLPFTRALAGYGAADFVEQVLLRRLRLGELWIGHDHGLGKGREGDERSLRALGERLGFPVEVVAAVSDESGTHISSTAIRRAVAAGDIAAASAGLGRRYSFRGRVVPGHRRGRLLGFPTLNIALPSHRKLLPPEGVYAVALQSARGNFGGMMNLGPRPTFDDAEVALEVHLFDGDGDWYDAEVRVEFVTRLRDVMRFPNAEALVAQLGRDAEAASRALTEVAKGLRLKGSTHPLSTPRVACPT